MSRPISKAVTVSLAIILCFSLAGCTFVFQKGRRSDIQKIERLENYIDELNRAKSILEDRLKQEIADKQVSLKMAERGLVITFVADVLFDSGKSKIRSESFPALDKVSRVLIENVPDLSVGIEGHTDNQPIKLSGWKSNWELSTSRALSVLHHLVDQNGISPSRVSAIGYGEYHPVASNDTREGRQANRRVEIVILPKTSKVKEAPVQKNAPRIQEPEENLK